MLLDKKLYSNQIIKWKQTYNVCHCSSGMLFQEESLRVNWQLNQDSSMVERQARDLEVQVRVPIQVQIFLLKCENVIRKIVYKFEWSYEYHLDTSYTAI